MKGADKYTKVFQKAEQIGRLYLLPRHHARGDTFEIYVLPEGESVVENGGSNSPLNKNAVEVYGIISGYAGWDESYGWLHKGEWVKDFENMYNLRLAIIEDIKIAKSKHDSNAVTKEDDRIQNLLNTY